MHDSNDQVKIKGNAALKGFTATGLELTDGSTLDGRCNRLQHGLLARRSRRGHQDRWARNRRAARSLLGVGRGGGGNCEAHTSLMAVSFPSNVPFHFGAHGAPREGSLRQNRAQDHASVVAKNGGRKPRYVWMTWLTGA
jgi:hypothetical protein